MSLSSQHVWEGLINEIRNWRVKNVNMKKEEKIITICRWYDFYLEKSEKLAKKISKFKSKYWSQWIFLYISSHSVQFSHSVVSDYLRPHGVQHTTLPCPSPAPQACSNSSIESVMPSNHLILCHRLLLPPSIFPSIRVSSNESALHIRWCLCCHGVFLSLRKSLQPWN